jgi:S-adenosyl-L-methionine hydrolase (adenosine-forming)
MNRPIITLTTDFGQSSSYVAQMKGVILGICPDATIVDITHAVPPQNIMAGAIALRDATPHFPSGTIHVAVVDPGVGTERRIIYVEAGGQRYVGPDNGLLCLVTRGTSAVRIIAVTNEALWRETVSHTFHGRDIMAPVAARLAMGLPPADLGQYAATMEEPRWPQAFKSGDTIHGSVTHIDSFGNAITNIPEALLDRSASPAPQWQVSVAGCMIQQISANYAQRRPGEFTALIGSSGYLEIAVVNGSATVGLDLRGGEEVVVKHISNGG